ncbi:MAG: hypothetical protein HRU20_31850 [Pseudomonadales bacterium]|nr:hypothetical protein [Pseudomonadales bacterium]
MSRINHPIINDLTHIMDNVSYNPMTNWARFFNPQFIINNNNANDLEIENHVLKEVGSYGKQLSTLLQMVDLLRNQLLKDSQNLTATEKETLEKFDQLLSQTQLAVTEFRGELQDKDVGVFSKRLASVKDSRPHFVQNSVELIQDRCSDSETTQH